MNEAKGTPLYIHNYSFIGNFNEFGETTFTAPNIDEAWKIFLSIDHGEYGIADESEVNKVIEEEKGYLFYGTIEQWYEAVKNGEVE